MSRRADARADRAVSPASRSARSICSWARPNSPRRASSRAVLPGLGDLFGPSQGRAADLVPGQLLDPLGDPAGLAGVEIGADLNGHAIGQAESGRGQGVGRGAQPFGDPEVVDRAGQVVGLAPATRTGDQLHGQLAPELDGVVMVGHVGPGGQHERLIETAGAGRLLRLPQSDSPLSQHG